MRINKKVLKSMSPDSRGRATSMYLLGKNKHGVIARAVQVNNGVGYGCVAIPGASGSQMARAKITLEGSGFTVYGIGLALNDNLGVDYILEGAIKNWEYSNTAIKQRPYTGTGPIWQHLYYHGVPLMFLKKNGRGEVYQYAFVKEGKAYGKKY